MRLLRKLLIVLVLAAASYGGWRWWSGSTATAAPSVITATVARGTIEQTVLASGVLKPARLVAVGAQVSGRITALHVRVGQQVEEGTLLAEIDSVTQTNELRTAEAQLAAIRAQLQERQATLGLNQRALERQQQLLSRVSTTTAEVESAEAALAVTQAQIEALHAQIAQSEVAIETATANLGYTRITAPISGTVLAVISQEGQTVNASSSTPTIAIIGQLDVMTVHAEISEADITRVEAGQEVWFTTLGDSATRYRATLGQIEPAPASIRSDSAIDSSSSSSSASSTSAIYYNATFDIPNPDGHLRTYQTVQVNIVLGRAEDVLTLPATALGAAGRDGFHAVRVQGVAGEIESRRVRVGLNDRITAEVQEGLAEGDRVVTGQAGTASARGFSRGGPPMMGL